MTEQILYFPDQVNLQAFILLEKIPPIGVNKEKSLLQLPLTNKQVEKACRIFGAVPLK